MFDLPKHMWLAGDGEGVVLVCEGPCPDGGHDNGQVVATYGLVAKDYTGIPRFPDLDDLRVFLEFIVQHGQSCPADPGGA